MITIQYLTQTIKGEELWTLKQTITYWYQFWHVYNLGILPISLDDAQTIGNWFITLANTKI